MTERIVTRMADWNRDRELIRRIRETVFVREQKVDPALEWDGVDSDCRHALAGFADTPPVATGRLQKDGKIGRMAVLPQWRGRGLGIAILEALIAAARQSGLDEVYLHAQTHALAFYERTGFAAEGPEFDEAGIPHRLMRRRIGEPL